MDPTPPWVEAQTNRAPKTGTLEAGGRTWTTYVRDTKVQNSLVDDPRRPASSPPSSPGTASFEEMADFVDAPPARHALTSAAGRLSRRR